MSPKNKKKLNNIRRKLDIIDNSILGLIKSRTALVTKVLQLKKYKYQIIDRKRIKEILKNIRKKSIKQKIDPKITDHIWKNMIRAYINFEKRNFKKK